MKAGWEVKPLGEVCDVLSGFAFKSADYCEAGHFLVRIGNVQDSELVLDKPKYVALDNKTKRFELNAGDILTSLTGNIGRVAVVKDHHLPAALNQRVARLARRSERDLDHSYFLYFLYSDGFGEPLRELSHGAAQQNVSPKAISNLPIPIPPLEEQKRIVVVLDAAFEGLTRAKENAETNLQNARELFQSYLDDSIKTASEKFGTKEVSAFMDSIVDCVNKTAPKAESQTPFKMVRTSNIRNGKLDLNSVNFVTLETYETWTRRQVPRRGDVLLTREAPMGETALVDTDDKIFLGQRVVSYRADEEKMAAEFLLFSFMSRILQDQFSELGSGSTVQHIRVPHTKTLKVPNVPIEAQEKLVEVLIGLRSRAQSLEDRYRTKLTDIAELRQSLLQKAFAGELT